MVHHLHGDLPRLRRVEGDARRAVELAPFPFVDLGLQGLLEPLVRLLGAEEVGVPQEEALAVVIGVDEPRGDVVRAAGSDPPEPGEKIGLL